MERTLSPSVLGRWGVAQLRTGSGWVEGEARQFRFSMSCGIDTGSNSAQGHYPSSVFGSAVWSPDGVALRSAHSGRRSRIALLSFVLTRSTSSATENEQDRRIGGRSLSTRGRRSGGHPYVDRLRALVAMRDAVLDLLVLLEVSGPPPEVALKCTNTSALPSSGVVTEAFSERNHFTVRVAYDPSFLSPSRAWSCPSGAGVTAGGEGTARSEPRSCLRSGNTRLQAVSARSGTRTVR
jgi:hypothetical protein